MIHPIAKHLHKVAADEDFVGNRDPRKMPIGRLALIGASTGYSGYTGWLTGDKIAGSLLKAKPVDKLLKNIAHKRALKLADPSDKSVFNPTLLKEYDKLNRYGKGFGKTTGGLLGTLSGLVSVWLATDPGVRKAMAKAWNNKQTP